MIDESDRQRLTTVLTELYGQPSEKARIITTTGAFPTFVALLPDRILVLQKRLGDLRVIAELMPGEYRRLSIAKGFRGVELRGEINGVSVDLGHLQPEDAELLAICLEATPLSAAPEAAAAAAAPAATADPLPAAAAVAPARRSAPLPARHAAPPPAPQAEAPPEPAAAAPAAAPAEPRRVRAPRRSVVGTLFLAAVAVAVLAGGGFFDSRWYERPADINEAIVVYSTWATLFDVELEPAVVVAGAPLVVPLFQRAARVALAGRVVLPSEPSASEPAAAVEAPVRGLTAEGLGVAIETVAIDYQIAPARAAAALERFGSDAGIARVLAEQASAIAIAQLGSRRLVELAAPAALSELASRVQAELSRRLESTPLRIVGVELSPPSFAAEAQTVFDAMVAARFGGRAPAAEAGTAAEAPAPAEARP